MALSTAIYTVLRLNANVLSTFGTNIYAGVAPHDTSLPCIVYEIQNIAPTIAIGSDSDWDECAIVVTVVGTKHSDVETYAGYIRTALQSYSGTVDTEKIDTVKYESQSASYDPDWTNPASPAGVGAFMRTLNFTLIRL